MCFRELAFQSRGSSCFVAPLFSLGLKGEVVFMPLAPLAPLVVTEVSGSGKSIIVRLGDPSSGVEVGLTWDSMPFELSPTLRAIFSHMLAR